MQPKHLPRDIADKVRTATKQRGKRQIAREAGLSSMTIARALDGHPVTDETLVALARIAPKTRTADEFAGKVGAPPVAPRMHSGPYSWDLSLIRAARDDQMRGRFEMPVRLAEAMRCDDALFTARRNRIAPQASVQAKLTPASGARGAAVLARAKQSVFISRSVLEGVNGTLADHGIAIGVIDHEPTEDGTRIDFRLREWPLEHVRWNESSETLETRDRSVNTIPIVHGDGTWVVFRKYLVKPWTQEACILPGALIWAAHAEGIADWSGASRAHGLAKIVGMLPEGVSLNEAGGELTPEARTFLQMMQGLASGDAVAGVRPAGSEVDFLSNGSTAWQVFSELLVNREKAAARIYNGTDAALGSVGGAPGVDIAALFNIASSIIQGDFAAIETALNTGVYEPWCAVNEGTSRYAPRFEYELPDADAAAKAKERQEKRAAFFDAIEKMRGAKLIVDQTVINQLAADYGVIPAPVLAAEDQQTSTLVLAPTDVAKVVRVREARAAQGLPPFGDERDNMTINELDTWLQAKNTPAPAPATP